jgi:ABC-type branched-subunit amino acid transport system ATPase component
MELTKIKIEKFKKIDAIELPISGLNILVGANGSGKSSILQATHLASCLLRQAPRIRPNGTSIVNVKDLDYLPSDEYWRLGHGADWGNQKTSPQSEMTFVFEDENGEGVVASCQSRAARNAGISVTGTLPEEVRSMYRGHNRYFSGFIPGISGVPNQEAKQSKRVVMKACSFGDSNVYLRNALNLLTPEDLHKIESWLSSLMGEVSIEINFSEDKDLLINAEVTLDGLTHPLELLGTGYIQLIQIFCYVLLFRPKILLIDEPDIHLHPNVQEKLASSLAKIAQEMDVKILLTTHSPFIVRGAPIDTNIYWLEDGKLESDSRDAVELALGWGAFGKKIIVVSEDKNIGLLKKLVSQWPQIDKFVTFHPGRGYKNLLKLDQAQELHDALGGKYKLVVHRDRDSLTDNEVTRLTQEYTSDGILLWVTEQSDIESYFCRPEFISDLIGCAQEDAESYLSEVLSQNVAPIRDQFNSQRQSHNQELYAAGGSPENATVWDGFQGRHLNGAKGKFVFGQLKNRVPDNQFSEQSILNHTIGIEMAGTLKTTLEGLL